MVKFNLHSVRYVIKDITRTYRTHKGGYIFISNFISMGFNIFTNNMVQIKLVMNSLQLIVLERDNRNWSLYKPVEDGAEVLKRWLCLAMSNLNHTYV